MEQGREPMDESASAKRRRIDEDDEDDDSDPSSLTRSNIWFADGNLVIQAEATQFRVHSSVLSMHSSVLKDFLKIPQPEDRETADGCPVVRMLDHAADLELVLPVLYGNDPR